MTQQEQIAFQNGLSVGLTVGGRNGLIGSQTNPNTINAVPINIMVVTAAVYQIPLQVVIQEAHAVVVTNVTPYNDYPNT